jgi:DNA-binding protein Fis
LTCELLPEVVTGKSPSTSTSSSAPSPNWDFESLSREVVQEGIRISDSDANNLHSSIVDRVEKELISQVLATCNYVQTKAATRLGINRNTLHKKMKDYNLEGLEPGDG